MPSPITAYRIFIASPGGLADERALFRQVVNSYNEADAIERGVIFLPVGWEITPGGVGRPQQLINADVRRSDYFFLVLWDRWGSPPQVDPEGGYKSGSEEEFGVASDCHTSGSMRDIVVLFKDVDQAKLRDPGPQLSAVLTFRQKLETDKNLYFETFDTLDAFADKLRRHLPRWVRDHEEGAEATPPPEYAPVEPVVPVEAPAEAPEEPSSNLAKGAEDLAKQGRFVEAERVFAEIGQQADLDSLNRYGAVLVEKGSLASAEKVFQQLHDLARDREKNDWVVASLNNLARLYIAKGDTAAAETSYREALRIREATLGPDHAEVAASLNNLAELYTSLQRFGEAEPLLLRALQIQGVTLVP